MGRRAKKDFVNRKAARVTHDVYRQVATRQQKHSRSETVENGASKGLV